MNVDAATLALAAAAIDQLDTAVLIVAPDGRTIFHNHAAARLLGLTTPMQSAPFGEGQLVVDALCAVVRGGGAPGTVQIAVPGDATRSVDVRVALLGDGTTQLLLTAVESTHRESLRLALGRRARELAAIFDATPSTVRVFDADGTLRRANHAARAEYPPDAQPGTLAALIAADRPIDGVTGEPVPPDQHPAYRALAGEPLSMRMLQLHRTQGGKMVESHAVPIRDSHHQIVGVALVDRDVTEREQLRRALTSELDRSSTLNARVFVEAQRLEEMVEQRSRELLALQESRARARRLAALGQLAAGVMHDVNNALNPIMSAAWLLSLKADDAAAVRDYATRIQRAAETGAATAARVGRFIRQDPLDVAVEEFVHLPTVAEEVIDMTRALWAERADGGSLRYVASHHPDAWVRGLAGELREALLNLVQNAVDAMPRGGELSITTGCDASTAWIEVRDTGIGMSDEVIDRAFEPFFSTKGPAGSGLGLSEVYGIAHRHRGTADIESALGAGTVVRLRFPRVSPATPSVAAAPPSQRPQRVLLVEDHDDGRELVSAMLTMSGHIVDAVATMTDAQARLQAVPYDVLISDLGLPDGSGWELMTLARDRYPSLRRVVVTGWEPRVADMTLAHRVLRKPVAAADLLLALQPDASTLSRTDRPSERS
jgi:signal transduction histidine kinase/ActR/RegA family two-component response regulator